MQQRGTCPPHERSNVEITRETEKERKENWGYNISLFFFLNCKYMEERYKKN